jgi:hypothetical protein
MNIFIDMIAEKQIEVGPCGGAAIQFLGYKKEVI